MRKFTDIKNWGFAFVIIILINIISSYAHFRLDLTSEKRYSLSDTTIEMLETLEDYVTVTVYLEGDDFPAGFVRLNGETRQMLDEFKAYSNFIEFEFIDPQDNEDEKAKNELLSLLAKKGLEPTSLQVKDEDSFKQQIIVPGALVNYRNREAAVQLLKNRLGSSPERNLNSSIQELEYEFVNAIKNLQKQIKPRVAFIDGHDELDHIYVTDFSNALKKSYAVQRFDIREFVVDSLTGDISIQKQQNKLNSFEAIIIAKPRSSFTGLDKFLIDQYVMQGGKILWLLDAVNAEMDSLNNTGEMLAAPMREVALEDILFKYGARVNNNLIQDAASARIPVPASYVNNQPQWELRPWLYFPIIIPNDPHPVTNNLDAIKMDFVSTIDTIRAPGIKKTALLRSSPYTKVSPSPNLIRLQSALQPPNQQNFKAGRKMVAVLLEGSFESYYKNRISPANESKEKLSFTEQGVPTRMIVVSDGDIIRNPVSGGQALPLGYDRYEKRQYANKEFLLNAIDYLVEEDDMITIRSRELKLRLLDKNKVNEERSFWQILNTLLPVLVLIVFGLIRSYLRKKKYSR